MPRRPPRGTWAKGVRLLAAGSWPEAVAVLEEALGIVRRAGLRHDYAAPVLPWLATALRAHAESVSPTTSVAGAPWCAALARVARRAWWMAWCYRNNAPHALRERALVAALDGRRRRARRLLRRSMAIAERQGARYEHAQSRLAWNRMGLGLGTAPADQVGGEAAADIASMVPAPAPPADSGVGQGPASLSLADRFTTLLAVGRRIASAPSTTAVHAAVREAAVTLLGGALPLARRPAAGTTGSTLRSGRCTTTARDEPRPRSP